MTLKPNANYKMKKSSKMILANVLDKNKRNELKRMIIQADLMSQIKPKETKKNRENSED
jgi:hypothetical protein